MKTVFLCLMIALASVAGYGGEVAKGQPKPAQKPKMLSGEVMISAIDNENIISFVQVSYDLKYDPKDEKPPVRERSVTYGKARLYGADIPDNDQKPGEVIRVYIGLLLAGKKMEIRQIRTGSDGMVEARFIFSDFSMNESRVTGEYSENECKIDLASHLILRGMAWSTIDLNSLKNPKSASYELTLAANMQTAQAAKSLLWSQKDPVAPWVYRNNKSVGATPSGAKPKGRGMVVAGEEPPTDKDPK